MIRSIRSREGREGVQFWMYMYNFENNVLFENFIFSIKIKSIFLNNLRVLHKKEILL